MCLAAWATAQHGRFAWVLAANRDEFFDRPAAPLARWQPHAGGPWLLGGRDLSAGGTWLAVSEAGHLALLTNVREPGQPRLDAAPSRGALVVDALVQAGAAAAGPAELAGVEVERWLQAQMALPRHGWNLLLADLHAPAFWWASNRAAAPVRGDAGLHGLSNAALDTPWPKLVALKARLADAVAHAQATGEAAGLTAAAFAALADRKPAADATLPHTGVAPEIERSLSAAFIRMPAEGPARYGTRCSTVLVAERTANGLVVTLTERRWASDGGAAGETELSVRLGA